MSVCEHCKYRNSYDCGDGWGLPKNGCDEFELEFSTLSKKQQKAIRRILSHEDDNDDCDW